jgi:hypothetical protein
LLYSALVELPLLLVHWNKRNANQVRTSNMIDKSCK